MMILVPTLMVAGATTLSVLHFYFEHRSEQEAHKFIRDCHGDLPPPSFFKDKGYSTVFLATVMRHYVAADHEREKKEKERKKREGLPRPTGVHGLGKPINPLNESDCPECANGMAHEECRDGWRLTLYRANGVNYEALPEWDSPCPKQLCSGNCGSCGSDHCGICGVKPNEGGCDLFKHAAFERKFNMVPEGLYPEFPRLDALQRLRKRIAAGAIRRVQPICDECHNRGYVFDFARLSISACPKCEVDRKNTFMSFSDLIRVERKDG